MRGIRRQASHQTLAAQKHALIGEAATDFSVGDRVMTVDGFPGRVAEILDGPYQKTEDYKIILDHGMGGGTYTSGQLRPEVKVSASVVEASEVYASIPFEAVTDHTANLDYPELENILTERLPNENIRVFAANNTAQDDSDDDESDKLTQQSNDPDDDKDPSGVDEDAADQDPEVDEDTEQTGPQLPNVTPPSSCSYCGSVNFGDPQMTGRGTRMRCEDCNGTMVSSGGQWQPEFPNSSQNNASEQGDSRSGGAAGVASLPDANYKVSGLQTDAGLINWVVDKIYDRLQERVKNDALDKNWAAPSHDNGMAGQYVNCPHCVADNSAIPDPSIHAHNLTIHSSLHDGEWGFHITASWMDVQAKARRIRSEGHVKIVSSSNLYVVGEVKGDHNVYETQLNYVVGSKKVADWACGCKWASYTWGRSKPFARFEGRLCSHALALQYEAGARGMFGKDVHHDTSRPDWQKAHQPVVVQFDKADDKNLTRRAVPPGNMKRTFSSLTLDSDGIFPEASMLDLAHPPIYAFAVNMLDHNEPVTSVIQMFANFGVEREAARQMMHEAWAEPANDGPESHAERRTAAAETNEALFDQNAAPRDLSDHDADDVDHKKHRTNDAREHALHWGWGYPTNVRDLIDCPQCTGSGCGHCAGLGQVPASEEASPTESPISQTPDETADSGKAITSDGVSASLRSHANEGEFFHGTRHVFKPGQILTGGHGRGGNRDGWGGNDHVYYSGRHDVASLFAEAGNGPDHDPDARPRVYKVEPIEGHEADPDEPDYAHSWRATHVRVKHEVPYDEHGVNEIYKRTDAGGDPWKVHGDGAQKNAAYNVGSPMPDDGNQGYAAPTPHSHTQNPGSTGWASSQDPGDWGRSLISNNFGVTFDASLHTTAQADSPFEGPTVSGVALKAHDTGRVLMIQRSHKDESDPAKGTWEFPGGHHEKGDATSLHAGIREWEEEVGQPFPSGGHVSHTWRSGPYQGHVVVIPSEESVDFSKGRSETNPDDPDGDDHEQAAWWDPEHAKKNPALREELKGHGSWGDIKRAASLTDDLSLDDVLRVYTTLHEEPEGALPSTDGGQDEDVSSTLAGDSVDGPHVGADDAESIRTAFLQSAGALALVGDNKELLAKVAMKDFNHQEQQELINEGMGDRARNFNDLKIAGTHYEMINDDDGDDWF
jgi:8-oxo-dGTP pyrophosphatase MutT (NUDIX family)